MSQLGLWLDELAASATLLIATDHTVITDDVRRSVEMSLVHIAAVRALVGPRRIGRPRLSINQRKQRLELIDAARTKRLEYRAQGMKAHDATAEAAEWAANDARNEGGLSPATILRDMQRSPGTVAKLRL
jgi:hypothetical protein